VSSARRRSGAGSVGVATAATLVSLATLLSACAAPAKPRVAAKVPLTLVPAKLSDGLTLAEYPGDRKAFANAGSDSLVADGRLWEIHEGHLLVGTLEAATVTTDVSLTNTGDRSQILDGAMVGSAPESIDVHGVGVAVASAPERTLYVWFGREVFEVLQLDDQRVDPEAVLSAVLDYQQGTGLLQPEALPSVGAT
jgi:hypothetical protein